MGGHERLGWLPLPAARVDRDGVIVDGNERLAALLGAGAVEGACGAPVSRLLPDEDDASARLHAAAGTGRPLRLQARRATGVPLSVEAFVGPTDGDGSVVCMFSVLCDERLVSEAQRILDVAFETAPIGMALFDTDGRYIRTNPALCTMLARPAEVLLGARDQEFTHPDDRQADVDAAWRILNGEIDTFLTEKRFLRPDGSVVWAIAHLTFLRDDGGRPLCWVGQFTDITARKAAEEQLRFVADHDELTGVASRRRVLDELDRAVASAPRDGRSGAVLLLDLDGFKAVNDQHGHTAGDRVLRAVAGVLTGIAEEGTTVGRLGGDEFVVVMPGASLEDARALAVRARRAVLALGVSNLDVSVGVASFDDSAGPDGAAVLEAADAAMYQCKAQDGHAVMTCR